jgi:prepilin-type N-terminal cleavage/methylation domain-containing protein
MKLLHKNLGKSGTQDRAFTLVEMMVVIAIVAILAGIAFPVVRGALQKAAKAKVKAEFAKLDTAIQEYHTTYNSYPLDNATNIFINPLYYELLGSTWNNTLLSYDLVGERILENDVRGYFNCDGLRNVTHDPADATAPKAKAFLSGLSTKAFISITNMTGVDLKVLRLPVPDSSTNMVMAANGDLVNVWRYRVGTNAVYNKGKYDLWGEFEIGGTRYRMSNWEKDVVLIENPKM